MRRLIKSPLLDKRQKMKKYVSQTRSAAVTNVMSNYRFNSVFYEKKFFFFA